MVLFREALKVSELYDVGQKGNRFTQSNRHNDETFTKEHLDRVVVNPKWNDMYAGRSIEVLASRCSDHKPILFHCKRSLDFERAQSKGFKYETAWALEEECSRVIEVEWKRSLDARDPELRVQGLKQLQDKEEVHNIIEKKRVQEELGQLMDQVGLKWKQRAKKSRYQFRDRNTKYFHACTTYRRRKSSIKQILNNQNRLVNDPAKIEGAFKHYLEPHTDRSCN